MDVILDTNTSEKNCMGKTLIHRSRFAGSLREQSSIINPVIRIEANSLPNLNYAFIPEFRRYYFVQNVTNLSRYIWELSLAVDVIESFKDSIKENYAIISATESTALNRYIEGEQWKTYVKNNTDIITFPNGLLENGEYILITAGG